MSVATTRNISAIEDIWLDVVYTINSGSPTNLTLFSARTFRCTQAPQGTIGSTVNIGAQFGGNTKSIDILNGLISQFNLVLTPVKGNRSVIKIETFDDWIRQGEIKDWTQRYDTAKRIGINHTVDEQPKEIFLKASNDVDRFSKTTIENDPFYQYGTLRIIADNNISQGEQEIGDFFGPVVLGGPIAGNSTGIGTNGDGFLDIDLNLNLVLPHLYKFENGQAKPYIFKPRLGYKVTNPWPYNTYIGATGGSADLLPSGSLYATISNVSALPVVSGSTKDLHYNNTYGLFTYTNNLDEGVTNFTNYWQTYLESLYWEGSKKVTLDLYFEPHEYKDIELNDRILIKNQMYRINKISGFNATYKDVVRVELIKLYPAYATEFIPEPEPVPTPTPTPTPTPAPSPTPTPTPTSYSLTLYMNTASGTNPPQGWSSDTLACLGTGTPITVYLSSPASSLSQVYTNGYAMYIDSGLTTPYLGGNTWFKDVSSPNAGNVFAMDNLGFFYSTNACGTPCYTYSIENYDLINPLYFRYKQCDCTTWVENQVVAADSATPDFCACEGTVQRVAGSNSYVVITEATTCTV